jgi:hypothetical protein
MKIKLQKDIGKSHFWELENGDCKINFRYNDQAKSLRLLTGDKQLYFLEETGFLRSKITFNNEYNQPFAELHFNAPKQSGTIRTEQERFHFDLVNGRALLTDKNRLPIATIEFEAVEYLNSFELAALLYACLCTQTEAQLGFA